MPRTPALLAAITLSVYGSSAFPQGATPQQAAPPTGRPAQAAADTSDEALTRAIRSGLDADAHHFVRHVSVRVDSGVATVSGFVHSASSIFRARTIATNTLVVTRVVT